MYNPIFTIIIHILIFVFPSSAQNIPAYTFCTEDQTPVFLLQHNASVGAILRTVQTRSPIDCTDLCAASQECIGVQFINGVCKQMSTIGNPDQTDQRILSKNCVKSGRICSTSLHFDAYEQKILVGFAREVVSADSLTDCMSACLNAFDTFGFECESIMYYPIDSECILNTEDRLDRPDLWVDEHDDTVIYLDNNCAASQCYAPYVTQYISVEGKQLLNELDHTYNVDIESCESLCTQRLSTTANDFNCKSFMYNNITNTCFLSDERSRPLGREILVDAPGMTYYEKKCFASPRTCRNAPSFSRVPQMILVGFAAFVMENVPSVTMCLDQCTNPPPETGNNFVCKSVMYYYNEQECILNAETRHSKSDLFIPEGEEFQVDYFDIVCHLEKEDCPAGTNLRSVRTINSALPEGESALHLVQSHTGTVAECLQKCHELAPEKCRSFNYDKLSSECDLLYVNGDSSIRPTVSIGVDLYDVHCLAVPKDCSKRKDGALYSRYLYTEHKGVASEQHQTVSLNRCLDLCAFSSTCDGVNYNRRNGQCDLYATITKDLVPSTFTDFYKNLCLMDEVDNGESAASNVPPQLKTNITRSQHRQEGDSKRTKPHLKEPEHFRRHPESTEIPGARPETVTPVTSIRPPLLPDQSRPPVNKAQPLPVSVISAEVTLPPGSIQPATAMPHAGLPISSGLNINPLSVSKSAITVNAEQVNTICNYEGIKVQVKSDEAFSGVMFVKNKYDSCRVEVSNSDSAILVLGLPPDFGMRPVSLEGDEEETSGTDVSGTLESMKLEKTDKKKAAEELRLRRQADFQTRDCGIVDMMNGTYKSTVVIQTNNLGIPGLVTSMDQIYEISCDYSSMLGGKVLAGANLTVNGPEASLIQPRGKIELGNPVLMQVLDGSGEHHPVIQAKLGDILELRWEIVAMDEELDFFVHDCFAEPGGVSRSEEKLQLVDDGCPTAAVSQKLIKNPIETKSSSVKIAQMQAFRFDSSSSVRLTCNIDICKGQCIQAKCNFDGILQPSWGRRKRSENSVNEYETTRYKVPRHVQATTSIVIIDPLQQLNEPISLFKMQNFEFEKEDPSLSVMAMPGQTCMTKVAMLSVFGLLFILTVVQAAIVAYYVFRRLAANPKSLQYAVKMH